ncbi:NAD dependent epimerase/dehydratase family protein [Vibrio aerogenes CECT 7868]|uniref:NAD dependent epimerase/dehydratase family protein n=1 Tax=Vibrio aerogenes CECT 7868 TaxID=1216006 RepID=A0A1M6DXK6_9VIBR|nr:DUF2867 domain-containing protein [Vibrio aerogenes]SHI77748.1 NAD dependent epimerase/dehydratase family protein [Vibrio aerogenes CECT 7868]
MKKVLVLGASGYIGSQLVPLLLEKGYSVTAATRQTEQLKDRLSPHINLRIIYLDLADFQATQSAVPDFDLIYFLVHGMAYGEDFIGYELSLAENFRRSLSDSQAKHIIYLSAIQPGANPSLHVRARKMTGESLRKLSIPVTELRAGVVIGPGSAAFEIMRDFVYNLPLLITPKWVDSCSNPIALDNLNNYLLALAEEVPVSHQMLEAGGPDTLSYREQFRVICQAANKPFRLWSTALLTPKMASYWLGMITSVPASIGKALLAGLKHDYIADNREICRLYPQQLIHYEDAVKKTIAEEGTFIRTQVWGFDPYAQKRWQPGFGYYAKQAGAKYTTKATAGQLWQTIRRIGQEPEGYFYANSLWRLREWLDFLAGGSKPVRRKPVLSELSVGDYIDSWKIIRCEKDKFLSLLFGMKAPGLGRLEFTITDHGDKRTLQVCAWWHPQGFRGLLYWFVMMPAHLFIFRGMVRVICRHAEQNPPDDKK